MAFKDKIGRSRSRFSESMSALLNRGSKLDEEFWEDLEETLILSDLGVQATMEVIDRLRDQATRKGLSTSYAVLDLLADEIGELFTQPDPDPFRMNPVCVLFVGINGAGKTTTVGKLAHQATIGGRKVLIGSADTFRAAAIEQLDVWGERSGVEVVKRERGADPASVCYDVLERAEELKSDLVLIDTSGRLHTSDDLMRELQKIVNVTRKRADVDVKTVLVIDATTGQNGLQQAREFDKALDLDGVVMTKLDGTAKGGIAVAVSHELGLPILRVGVGEGIEDLQPFDSREYAEALFGEMRVAAEEERAARRAATAAFWAETEAEVASDLEPEAELALQEEPVSERKVEEEVELEETIAPAPQVEEGADAEPEEEDGIDIFLAVEDEPEADDEPEIDIEAEGNDDEEDGIEITLEGKDSFRDKMRRWFA